MRRYFRARSGLGAIAGLALAVRQTTRPLVRLSGEVRRFGTGLDAPDLAVAGPREVRELSASFNEMKGRIRDLLAERSHMLAAIVRSSSTIRATAPAR